MPVWTIAGGLTPPTPAVCNTGPIRRFFLTVVSRPAIRIPPTNGPNILLPSNVVLAENHCTVCGGGRVGHVPPTQSPLARHQGFASSLLHRLGNVFDEPSWEPTRMPNVAWKILLLVTIVPCGTPRLMPSVACGKVEGKIIVFSSTIFPSVKSLFALTESVGLNWKT